jgi:hypothetical protein
MYAHRWALCCLVTVTSLPAFAQGTRVQVVLHNPNGTPDPILEEMKAELGALMGRAGFQIEWPGGRNSNAVVAGDLVMVELRGYCKPPSASVHDSRIVQMGSSAVADGKVLPFSWVDCTAVAQLLERYLSRKSAAQRELAYGRAMARVLAHELYHVLWRTQVHTASGLTKARLEPGDLLDEGAEFGNVTVASARDSARNAFLVRSAAHP